MVPGTGLEPARLSTPDPKSGVSANSTTRAIAPMHIYKYATGLASKLWFHLQVSALYRQRNPGRL